MTFPRLPVDEPTPTNGHAPFNPEQTISERAAPRVPDAQDAPDGTAVTPVVSGYVLEREAGSEGSPPMAFVVGQQKGPITLGRAGEFRVDGAGALATHGFLMFDGDGIYLCSADEASPIVANGARIPKNWTCVRVPCTVTLGRTKSHLRGVFEALPPPSRIPPRPAVSFGGPADPEAATLGAFDASGAVLAPFEEIPRSAVIVHESPIPAKPDIRRADDDEVTQAEPPRSGAPMRVAVVDDESTMRNSDVLAELAARSPASVRAAAVPAVDAADAAGVQAPPPLPPPTSTTAATEPTARRILPAPSPGRLDWLRAGLTAGDPRRLPILVALACIVALVLSGLVATCAGSAARTNRAVHGRTQ